MSMQILDILQQRLIPWAEQFGLQHLIVARQEMAQMRPRPGFRYSPRQLLGPRQGVRSFSLTGTLAKWPRDHLIESPGPLLTFVLEGKADMPFRNYWLHAQEGQGVFALSEVPRKAGGNVPYFHPERPPNEACVTINFSQVRGHTHIWLNRSAGTTHQTLQEIPPVYVLDEHVAQLLDQMQSHFVRQNSDDNSICRHLLQAFLLTLREDLERKRFVQPGLLHTENRNVPAEYNPIVEAQEYIRSHLHEPLTLRSVARQVRMARTQFALQFKRETKQTFNEFVTNCRMELAKVLLRETNYTLHFVRVQIGYRSSTYFNKIFLKTQGITPRQYRENQSKR